MKRPHGGKPAIAESATVLSVSPNVEDSDSLERILLDRDRPPVSAEWNLIASPTLAASFGVMRETSIPIVICECDMLPGSWREMLEHASVLPDPPLVIVASRLADEQLWAEAINLGAYDVLAKPFDATEVVRILSLAWQHWQHRHELHAGQTKQRKAAGAT